MGNQNHHRVCRVSSQIFENLPLCIPIQRGKRVVQNQNGLFMAERPCKRQPLCLAAGESYAAISHKSLYAIRHLPDFLIQADQTQVFPGVAFISHQDIMFDGIVKKLRVVPQIPDFPKPGAFVQFRKLFISQADAALVGIFAEKGLAEGGFSAGHRAGDADDLTGPCGK